MIGEDASTDGHLEPRRLHPASPFIGLILQARQALLPLAAALVLGSRRDSDPTALLFLGLALVGALLQFLAWGRFRYSVVGGALVVDKGLFQRQHREIPVDRIHHVEEVAKLYHRLFGVVSLKVDSGAGGSSAEITLSAVSRREAALLRAHLAQRPADPGPVVGAGRGRPALIRLGVGQLVVAGITNVPIAATAALIASGFQVGGEAAFDLAESAVDRTPSTAFGLGLVVLVVAVAYLAAAGVASVLANYGFVLERDGSELRTQRGLLDNRRAVADLRRLTVLRFGETFSRRALGLGALVLQTISGRSSGGVTQLTVPLLERHDLDRLLGELMPGAAPLPELEAHPPAARRRLLVRRLAAAAVPAAAAAWFVRPWGLVVGGLFIVLAACRAEVAFQNLGHGCRGDYLAARSGGLKRDLSITAWPQAESTRLRTSPLQRWAGLATLKVDVPQGRSVSIVDADPARLQELRLLALRRPAVP